MKKILFFLFFILFSFGNAQEEAKLIDKDANLYQVDEHFFRSEQLIPEDKEKIVQAGVKTIINLRFFTRGSTQKILNESDAIKLINKPLLTWNIQPKHIAEVLHLIRENQKNGSVLVHCYHGADRTGIMVAMYRIIFQNWEIEKAKTEMQQGSYGYHSIWKNLEKLFTEDKIKQVKEVLKSINSEIY